jgi:hypothetical protein
MASNLEHQIASLSAAMQAQKSRRGNRGGLINALAQETWPETSLVISNIETFDLPPKTGFSLSSALICVRTFLSWSPFFLIYAQSFLVSSVRGNGDEPTTAARVASGVTGFMNAAFGLRADFLAILIFDWSDFPSKTEHF